MESIDIEDRPSPVPLQDSPRPVPMRDRVVIEAQVDMGMSDILSQELADGLHDRI
jgi:hypothetical protein